LQLPRIEVALNSVKTLWVLSMRSTS